MTAKKRFLVAATAFAALAAGEHAASAWVEPGVPDHRVIYRHRSSLRDSWEVAYWVRVEQYLTEQDVKNLVCAVVQEEKPGDYSRLAIVFNYRLDSFNLVATEEYSQSRLADYAWTPKMAGNAYSLARWRNEEGEQLPRDSQFSSFDHTKQCPMEPTR